MNDHQFLEQLAIDLAANSDIQRQAGSVTLDSFAIDDTTILAAIRSRIERNRTIADELRQADTTAVAEHVWNRARTRLAN